MAAHSGKQTSDETCKNNSDRDADWEPSLLKRLARRGRCIVLFWTDSAHPGLLLALPRKVCKRASSSN